MSAARWDPGDLGFLDDAAASRAADDRRRRRTALGVSAAITVVWLVAVLATGNLDRVWDNIVAAPTMLFGSFVAGATPQGGGAVAFPVFTKGLGIPSEVARTFSLCIQTVGMGTATLVILIRRRPISVPAVLWSLPPAVTGLFAGLFLLSDRSQPFWPSVLPGPYVKVLFTLLVLVMAFVVFLGTRVPAREVRTSLSPVVPRHAVVVVVGAFLGGVASSQVGSGADVLLYLAVVVVLGLDPRVGVPTSVVTMAVVSAVGFVYLGLVQGHLDVTVADGLVTRLGGTPLPDPSAYPAGRFDLFGLWLAAVPVVCWGAPLGSAFAARLTARRLSVFVVVLAVLEGVTTVVFLRELRTDPQLAVFAVVGGTVLLAGLYLCARFRHVVVGRGVDPGRSLGRDAVDLGPGYLGSARDDEGEDPR